MSSTFTVDSASHHIKDEKLKEMFDPSKNVEFPEMDRWVNSGNQEEDFIDSVEIVSDAKTVYPQLANAVKDLIALPIDVASFPWIDLVID
jgi:hypothetical protein